MADTQKMRFLDVFSEDKDETLVLRLNLKIKGEDFKKGDAFRKGEMMAGIDFHLLRYFDLALLPLDLDNDIYQVTGFFPNK